MLDRKHLARVAQSGPEPVFATISGAHLYGFASPDSDVDLRGAFFLGATPMAQLARAGRSAGRGAHSGGARVNVRTRAAKRRTPAPPPFDPLEPVP
jgi:hypothetical protein